MAACFIIQSCAFAPDPSVASLGCDDQRTTIKQAAKYGAAMLVSILNGTNGVTMGTIILERAYRFKFAVNVQEVGV